MGMNFYLQEKPCLTCNRTNHETRKHIGKSSAGWCFALHVIPEANLNALEDWKAVWDNPALEIVDEDGQVLTSETLLDRITNRRRELTEETPHGYESWAAFHRINQSLPGPNGLLRHKISERHCLGHGDGTWDLIRGEFS